MKLNEFEKEYESLKKKFPTYPRNYGNVENSDYCENVFNSKNCYWNFNCAEMKDCLYCYDGFQEVDDIDCDDCVRTERCFECNDIEGCSDCYYLNYGQRCYDVWYSFWCFDCHDCFGCSNLSHKSYCIYNIQYTKKDYEKRLSKLRKEPPQKILNKLKELKNKFPKLNTDYGDADNSDYCNHVYFVKNLYMCFDCSHSQDSGYMEYSHFCNDCWESLYALNCERCTNALFSSECHSCYEILRCARCYDSFYLYNCFDCHDCFGCAFLTNKQYCILNIQYTKEEYEQKVKDLRKEMGIFFEKPKK